MTSRNLALVLATVMLASCRAPVPPATPSDVVRSFYAAYNGNFRQADSAVLSHALRDAVASAVQIEQNSRAAVKASEFPSDKPLLIEGEIFAGLYEGFTGYDLGKAEITDRRASVEIQFTNSHYATSWTDRVQLVEENGWKIDDVRYLDKKAGALGVRDVLRDFAQVAAGDPLLNPPRR